MYDDETYDNYLSKRLNTPSYIRGKCALEDSSGKYTNHKTIELSGNIPDGPSKPESTVKIDDAQQKIEKTRMYRLLRRGVCETI